MSYTTIVEALQDTIEAVSGTANVYEYMRYSSDIETRTSLFIDNGVLHTWMLTRTAAPSTDTLGEIFTRSHAFELHSYYQIDDSTTSEKTHQQLCDSVMNALNTNDEVVAGTAYLTGTAQLLEYPSEGRMFCGVLCHFARIGLTVEEPQSCA